MEHFIRVSCPRAECALAARRAARGLGLVCAAFVCAAALAGDAQKLAVVNVSFVFEKYLLVPDVQRRIDAQHEARKKELEQRGKELADFNRQMEEKYKQAGNSEEVFDLVQKLRKAQYVYERDVANLNEQIQKDYTREMRAVLSDIRQAIRQHAEANHYDLVLRSPDTDDPAVKKQDPNKMPDLSAKDKETYLSLTEPKTVMDVLERFHRNPVLYGAVTVDITNDVLSALNTAFMKRSIPKP